MVTEFAGGLTLSNVKSAGITMETDLQQALKEKWGRSYDVQLRRINKRVFLLVMWKYLEQTSFPLSEAEYQAHLEEVTQRLEEWGVLEQVIQEIWETSQRPRLGQAVSIALDLGSRASEWLL
jgi:hypothetical protein